MGMTHRACMPIVALSVVLLAQAASAASTFTFAETNLVSDGSVPAANTDLDLINPWGVSFSATSAFWVSDNNSGVTTLYNGAGTKQTVAGNPHVTIASPAGAASGFVSSPTGQVFNSSGGGFKVSNGTASAAPAFIFATEDGTISGWAPSLNPGNSLRAVDNSNGGAGAVYKGLAMGTVPGGGLRH
jgi:uncharacterized protein (TIGR03118 family)